MAKKVLIESPLLPALVVIFIIVATFANNAHALEWRQLFVPITLFLIPAVGIWFVLWMIKDLRFISATASTATMIVLLLYSLIPEVYYKGLAPVLVVVVSVGLLALFSKHINKSLQFVTIGLVVCILSSFGLAQYNMTKHTQVKAQDIITVQNDVKLPNIYFIIPDRFTSHEALLECGYDNQAFINGLRMLGFYVRDNALSKDEFKQGDRAASTRTLRYLASVFNDGEYIPLNIDYNVASEKVRYSTTVQEYIELGYKYYNIGSWYAETRISALTENNYIYNTSSIGELIYSDPFTTAIFDRSIGRYLYISPLLPSKMYAETERNRQAYQVETLKSLAREKMHNRLVFMHLLLPHVPFIWTADGKPQENTELGVIELYVEQVKYTETLLIYLIEYILTYNDDAIIIIQSDEGMCFTGADIDINYELSDTQFEGILTAWKLPVDNSSLVNIEPTEILKYTREVIQ